MLYQSTQGSFVSVQTPLLSNDKFRGMNLIEFSHVFKTYATGHQALHDINFSLATGEMAFLTGHSGAGKSTLLKLLIRMEQQTRGNIFIDKQNLDKCRGRQVAMLRREIGVIFQNPELLYDRSVFENVALPLLIARFQQAEIQKRVRAALAKVGLAGKEHLPPCALSCGEQQRVGIARAIVNTPRIILADEPTGNLDPDLALEIMRLFVSFNNAGVTILLATHNLPLVASFNYRVLTLKNGRIAGDTLHGRQPKYTYQTETL